MPEFSLWTKLEPLFGTTVYTPLGAIFSGKPPKFLGKEEVKHAKSKEILAKENSQELQESKEKKIREGFRRQIGRNFGRSLCAREHRDVGMSPIAL